MCNLCRSLDTSKVEAFGANLLSIVNHAGLSMMISIGHRTGLFDTLASLPPADISTIAGIAGLNERYVREWLGAMTVGRIIHHDAVAGTYKLPEEHAALLTRAASPNNFAAVMQFISVLGSVEDKIVDCFRNGGGVPYEDFRRFHEVMAEESGQTVLAALFEHILPLVPGLAERLERGIDVLDLGCGRGMAMLSMARRFPNSRFLGIDFSVEAIAWAKEQAVADSLTNVSFQQADAATFDAREKFDLIVTFDAIHDQARPDQVLTNLRRALRPDGIYLMQDIRSSSSHSGDMDHPVAPMLYTISTMHCMTVSLALGGMGLGTMWGDKVARRMLAEAGFSRIEMHQLAHDLQNAYYVIRP